MSEFTAGDWEGSSQSGQYLITSGTKTVALIES